ncbi:unnamed protein product, partial [Musa textilis]
MADSVPSIPSPNSATILPLLPPPPPPPPSCHPSDQSPAVPSAGGGRFSPFRWPGMRVTSEFDSDSSVFFHKVSCKLFDNLAKLKFSFQNDRAGQIVYPQLGFLTKHFGVLYDLESRNALLKGSFDIANFLQVRATHDVKTGHIGGPNSIHIGLSAQSLSVSCTCENNESIASCFRFGSAFLFKYHYKKEQQGEVAIITSMSNPSYKLEISSSVPSVGLPKTTVQFPLGEVSVERKDQETEKTLSLNGILKGELLNGVCSALYRDEDLNLRYCYKDEEMSFIPSISLPSNALSLAFKRRFSPSDKLRLAICPCFSVCTVS